MAQEVYIASTTAPVNIAVIKYWGKRNTALNLPTNSSISVTLSQGDLRTLTTACASAAFSSTRLWLNGELQDVSGPRQSACFGELKRLRAEVEAKDPNLPKLSQYHVHVVSENNFPTAAGLASSAAGFAALVRAIADLYKLPHTPTELSRVARQGSGSACRSLFGGYVAWKMGELADGSDSIAVEIAPASHWPSMRAVILVVSDAKKGVSSTAGMQATVATSQLFPHRANTVVPQRMEQMVAAITNRDFASFAKLTMADSNSFHSVCLDTTPPIFYLNDVSRNAIRVIEELNRTQGTPIAAYTFDAGPNAVVYYDEKNQHVVLGTLRAVGLSGVDGWDDNAAAIDAILPQGFDERLKDALGQGVMRVIQTGVGGGPVSVQTHLVGSDGLPLFRK